MAATQMSTEDKKPITSTLKYMEHLLKDVYISQLDEHLKGEILFYKNLPKPAPLTRKQKFIKKWKRFWNHIPDFYHYLTQYEYENWRYWDKDGY